MASLNYFYFQHRFRRFETLDGENHKARFGMAVASLGDINLDGAASGDSSIGYHGRFYVDTRYPEEFYVDMEYERIGGYHGEF